MKNGEKLGWSVDVPLGESEWDNLADMEFAGDKMSQDRLEPISFKPETLKAKTPARKDYTRMSGSERAHSDTITGTAAAVAGGALVGLGFVGAGLSAPIAAATMAGVATYNKLKNREEAIRKAEYDEEHNTDISGWKKTLENDAKRSTKK